MRDMCHQIIPDGRAYRRPKTLLSNVHVHFTRANMAKQLVVVSRAALDLPLH